VEEGGGRGERGREGRGGGGGGGGEEKKDIDESGKQNKNYVCVHVCLLNRPHSRAPSRRSILALLLRGECPSLSLCTHTLSFSYTYIHIHAHTHTWSPSACATPHTHALLPWLLVCICLSVCVCDNARSFFLYPFLCSVLFRFCLDLMCVCVHVCMFVCL
jgi:hypothetical protein